jgi:uncharacterized protein (DUF1684 family)
MDQHWARRSSLNDISGISAGAPAQFLSAETLKLSSMERKKTGRPHKGDRGVVRARLPLPLLDAVYAEAARRGMTVNDFIGHLAAGATGIPYDHQERLQISA